MSSRMASSACVVSCLLVLASCGDADAPTRTSAETAAPPPLAASFAAASAGSVGETEFTRDFPLRDCEEFETTGQVRYFSLNPGHYLRLEGVEDGVQEATAIRVLDQRERVGGVWTRVIEERHFAAGELVEVSRNFFAICEENGSVYYFGEDVDNYEDGQLVDHDGSWRHGTRGARAGLIMPALPLHGARYFQEVAPGAALDRAEILDLDAVVRTPAGTFRGALLTRESTPLEPGVRETKSYAPGIGLIQDNALRLVEYRRGASRDD